MNWAIFIRCLVHPRRFQFRFLTQFVWCFVVIVAVVVAATAASFFYFTSIETDTIYMHMITLLRVRAYEKSKTLLHNYVRFVWCARARLLSQIWSK